MLVSQRTKEIDQTYGRVNVWNLVLRTLLAALCLGSFSSSLQAQTLFASSDTFPTLSHYRSVEECLVATARIADSVTRSRFEFLDTLPFRPGTGRDSTPTAVVTAARQCAASFNPDSVVLTGPVETYAEWMTLYLTANRDDAADVVKRRRIAMARQHPNDPQELVTVLNEIVDVYGQVRPIRWSNAQEIGQQLESPDVLSDPVALFFVSTKLFSLAHRVEDTVVMRSRAQRMLALKELVPPEVKRSPIYQNIVLASFAAVRFLNYDARMDSLRRGPEAYVAGERALWNETSGKVFNQPIPGFVGETASVVTGNFWFASENAPMTVSSDHPRPAPGKISLVVFLRQGCDIRGPIFSVLARRTWSWSCWGTYANLRRLGQRYPSLEITLVTRTAGYSGNTGLMSPQNEAEILRKWWLGFHRIPATLAVVNTEFFRLEAADRRRIDRLVDNDINYLFRSREQSGHDEVASRMAYLIDTNGMVILSGRLESAGTEWEMKELLDVMTQRTR